MFLIRYLGPEMILQALFHLPQLFFFEQVIFSSEQTAAGEGFLEAAALAQFRKTHHPPPRWKVKVPRNLQQDPRFTDPEKTWVSTSSIATSFFGVRWDSVPWKIFDGKVDQTGFGKSRLVNLEFWVWEIRPKC